MASITFTDATGTATVTNAWPLAIRRFTGYAARPDVKAERAEALTGEAYVYVFAQLYDASFSLDDVDNADQALVMRLLRHCANAGIFSVATNDAAARTYPSVQCVGTDLPTATQDPVSLAWRVTFPRVRNVAAAPVEMLAIYG